MLPLDASQDVRFIHTELASKSEGISIFAGFSLHLAELHSAFFHLVVDPKHVRPLPRADRLNAALTNGLTFERSNVARKALMAANRSRQAIGFLLEELQRFPQSLPAPRPMWESELKSSSTPSGLALAGQRR